MKIQVLVATMKQRDFSKYSDMSITSSAIFANQSDSYDFQQKKIMNKDVTLITTNTKGAGLNRNIALSIAGGDILLFADDDMKYIDNYENIVEEAFLTNPQADALIFNIDSMGNDLQRRKNNRIKRVRFWNALNYGTARLAVRRNSILLSRLSFSNGIFGPGAIYSSGEDTLFIVDMLKARLKIYVYPFTIASVNQETSSWFSGYNCKYFYDKGALYAAISRKLGILLCLQDVIRHRKEYLNGDLKETEMFRLMLKGIRGYTKLCPYDGEKA